MLGHDINDQLAEVVRWTKSLHTFCFRWAYTIFLIRNPDHEEASALFAKSHTGSLWYDMMFSVCNFAGPCLRSFSNRPKMLGRWHRLLEASDFGSANEIKW